MLKLLNSKFFNNSYLCIFYLFTSFSFITCFKNIPLFNLLPKIAILWGGIISIRNLFLILKRKPKPIESFILLVLFVTFILNISAYFYLDNLKCWFVNFVMLLSIFYINEEKTINNIEKDILYFSIAYYIITLITSISSICLYIHGSTYTFFDFTIGNSSGIFSNENSLGISASISVLVSIYLLILNKNNLYKLFFAINIPIQLFALHISTSRGALIIFIATIITLLLILIKNTVLRYVLLFLPFIATFSSLFLDHEKMFYFTSGRNDLWMSAVKLLQKNYLIGIGNHDLVEKVRNIRSSVYLPGIVNGGLHNIYIQILTTNGFFALISFLCIIVVSVFYILQNIKSNILSLDFVKVYILLSICIGILLVNLFESNIFYIVSFISITFWTYLGYIISYIQLKNK